MKKIVNYTKGNVSLLGLIIVFVIGALVSRTFISPDNLSNLLRSASFIGFIAIGMTFVVLCGSIDISVGSLFALSGYLFIINADKGIFFAILFPVLAGIAVGIANGFLINELTIPPFIGTMATMLLVKGIVLLCTGESTVKGPKLEGILKSLGRGSVLEYLAVPFFIFLIFLFLSDYILKRREIGRNMYIVGGNEEAARMMGVSSKKTKYIAHIFCSTLTAAGGILFASRVGSAAPLAGSGYEMYAIAAVVIGGASLTGGVGKMVGTLFGTLIMGSFSNIFNLQKFINPVWQDVIVGTVLLIVIVIQAMVHMPEFKKIKSLFVRQS